MTCPECGGQLQATKKTWYNIIDSGSLSFYGTGPWHVYCENDHNFGENWDDYHDALDAIKSLGKGAIIPETEA